jgi:hypothetical protein
LFWLNFNFVLLSSSMIKVSSCSFTTFVQKLNYCLKCQTVLLSTLIIFLQEVLCVSVVFMEWTNVTHVYFLKYTVLTNHPSPKTSEYVYNLQGSITLCSTSNIIKFAPTIQSLKNLSQFRAAQNTKNLCQTCWKIPTHYNSNNSCRIPNTLTSSPDLPQ